VRAGREEDAVRGRIRTVLFLMVCAAAMATSCGEENPVAPNTGTIIVHNAATDRSIKASLDGATAVTVENGSTHTYAAVPAGGHRVTLSPGSILGCPTCINLVPDGRCDINVAARSTYTVTIQGSLAIACP
jgi:hypothetical protein